MTEKINTKGELEAVKEKFKEQGISLSGYFEVRELFEKGNLTKSGVKKIIQKYQKKDQPEIEKAQKKKAEEKLDTAKKKLRNNKNFLQLRNE